MLPIIKIKNKIKMDQELILNNQYKKYCKKYLNKRVNFIVRDYDENENEIKYKLKGKVIGFNNLGSRDDSAGYLVAVIKPDNFESLNLDLELFNEINLEDIESISKKNNIRLNQIQFRVTKEEQIAYRKLSNQFKIPISKIIRNYLNKLTKNESAQNV